jgi:hypothetical protein
MLLMVEMAVEDKHLNVDQSAVQDSVESAAAVTAEEVES